MLFWDMCSLYLHSSHQKPLTQFSSRTILFGLGLPVKVNKHDPKYWSAVFAGCSGGAHILLEEVGVLHQRSKAQPDIPIESFFLTDKIVYRHLIFR
jgi:hypothetical protein